MDRKSRMIHLKSKNLKPCDVGNCMEANGVPVQDFIEIASLEELFVSCCQLALGKNYQHAMNKQTRVHYERNKWLNARIALSEELCFEQENHKIKRLKWHFRMPVLMRHKT